MDEDRTIAQALAGVRDAESAFAFIEWFAADWLTPLRDGDGCTAEEVAAVEKRLGLQLPALMATFYRLLGWRTDLTRNQDTLIFLNSLRVVEDVLVYRIENQGCASWGIRVADLGLADPPTVFCEGHEDGRPWRRFLGSFSLAAVEMVLSESLVGRAGCHGNRPPGRRGRQRRCLITQPGGSPRYPKLSAGSEVPVSCSGKTAAAGSGYSRGTPRALPASGMRYLDDGRTP
jgi:hypothetical protein